MSSVEHYKNTSANQIVEYVDGVLRFEEWLPMVGYEGLYLVSNFGRIKSLRRNVILSQPPHKSGYLYVCLRSLNGSKSEKVHRIVATTWIDNPKNKPTVNHTKGDKFDNRIWRLEWATRKENVKHTFTDLGRKSTWYGILGGKNPSSKSILCVTTGKKYSSAAEAGRELGIHRNSITDVCRGFRNKVFDLKFEYAK